MNIQGIFSYFFSCIKFWTIKFWEENLGPQRKSTRFGALLEFELLPYWIVAGYQDRNSCTTKTSRHGT